MSTKKIITSLLLTVLVSLFIFSPFANVSAQSVTAADNGSSLLGGAVNTTLQGVVLEHGCTSLSTIDVGACLTNLLYYIAYVLPAAILGVSGIFFNALIGITLSTKIYGLSSFITDGWSVARDIANLFFIFVLLFVALQTILGIQSSNAKAAIAKLIVVALLINFSMFFVKIVIDTSNILALLFYNRITVQTVNPNKTPDQYTPTIPESVTGVQEKDISGIFVQAFKPQTLNSLDFYNNIRTGETISQVQVITDQQGNQTNYGGGGVSAPPTMTTVSTKTVPLPYLLVIILFSGIIFLYAAWCLFVAGIAFLGRLVGLWISIILAPLAFVSYIVPAIGNEIKGIGWRSWSANLLTLAFNAPIFMFFIYLIVLLSQSSFITSINTSGTDVAHTPFITILLLILIPMFVIMGLLKEATTMAKKLGGEIGTQIMNFGAGAARFVGGLAVGTASMGAGVALQSTVGAYYQKTLNDEDLRKRAAAGDISAQKRLETAKSLASNTFDFRNTLAGNAISKGLKINTSTKTVEDLTKTLAKGSTLAYEGLTGKAVRHDIDLGTQGGKLGQTERAKKLQEERSKLYMTTGPEAQKQDAAAKDYNDKLEKALTAARIAAKINNDTKFNEDDFKEQYHQGNATIYVHDPRTGKLVDISGNKFDEYDERASQKLAEMNGKENTKGGAPKVQTTNELNNSKKKDLADAKEYGKNYVVERNRAEEAVNKQRAIDIANKNLSREDRTQKFNEKAWRENKDGITITNRDETGKVLGTETYEYFGNNKHPRVSIDRDTVEFVAQLRKEVGESVKEVKEVASLAGRARANAIQDLKETESEIKDLQTLLEGIPRPADKTIKDLSKDDIKKVIDNIKYDEEYTVVVNKNLTMKLKGLEALKLQLDKGKNDKTIPIEYTALLKKRIDQEQNKIDELTKATPKALSDKIDHKNELQQKLSI